MLPHWDTRSPVPFKIISGRLWIPKGIHLLRLNSAVPLRWYSKTIMIQYSTQSPDPDTDVNTLVPTLVVRSDRIGNDRYLLCKSLISFDKRFYHKSKKDLLCNCSLIRTGVQPRPAEKEACAVSIRPAGPIIVRADHGRITIFGVLHSGYIQGQIRMDIDL